MRCKLKLSHKGLYLVSVLLAFELLFLGVLTTLLYQAERDASVATHAQSLTYAVDMTMRHFMDAGAMLAIYRITRESVYAQRFDEDLAAIPEEIKAVRELTSDDARQARSLKRIEPMLERWVAVLTEAKAAVDNGGRLFSMISAVDLQRELSSLYKQIQGEMTGLQQEAKAISARKPKQYAQSRGMVLQFLALGVVLNIAGALAIGFLFMRGIISRLGILVDNTSRLAQGKPLNPRMETGDEIAQVDHVFHDMAEALAEAERVKREFVSMISHDLKTPLTSIRASLELLEAGLLGQLSDKGQEVVTNAEREIQRLIALINELLDLEKVQHGKLGMKLDPVTVRFIMDRSVGAVKTYADKRRIAIEVAGPDVEFLADGNRLVQVVVNLLSNAIKFSPEGSTITVANMVDDGNVEFKVSDQGCGIPAAYQGQIFERFKQVSDSDSTQKGGTGLGLAICKAIVEEHGGTIGVESAEGKGSTFWFKLPRAGPPGR